MVLDSMIGVNVSSRESWQVMRRLLERDGGLEVFHSLLDQVDQVVALHKRQKSGHHVPFLRGAVFFIGMASWGIGANFISSPFHFLLAFKNT
jgi:hypothetical protein